MQLFARTGGHWIFYISAAYFIIGMISLYNGSPIIWISPLYVLFLAMPFWFPPLGRAINLDVTWDKDMFNWFKKDKSEGTTNVVPFPKSEAVPYVEPPEKPATIYYRFGITDKSRLAFQMGYSEITMNKQGVQNLIDQLEFFKNQLEDEQ